MNRRIVLPICVAGFLAAFTLILIAFNPRELNDRRGGNSKLLRDVATLSRASQSTNGAPSDADIFHIRLFPEPLVPICGKTTSQENAALMAAIDEFKNGANRNDQSAILAFLKQFPNSAWRAALLTNVGLEYRNTGWVLKALDPC